MANYCCTCFGSRGVGLVNSGLGLVSSGLINITGKKEGSLESCNIVWLPCRYKYILHVT